MAEIELQRHAARAVEGLQHESLTFHVALDPAVAVDLRPDLHQLASAHGARGHRVQDAAGIAQARHSRAVQDVRVDPCHLRCDVGAHAEQPPGHLVDELEGDEVEIAPAAREQGFHVLDHGRRHQLVSVGTEEIEQRPAQALDALGLSGQDIVDVLRKKPVVHG